MKSTMIYFVLLLSIVSYTVASSACYNDKLEPRPLKTIAALDKVLDKAFQSAYEKSVPHLPLSIEYCAHPNAGNTCVKLSPSLDSQCTKLTLQFSTVEKIKTSCNLPPWRKQCEAECHVWIGRLAVKIIYHTGQQFNFTIGWGHPVNAVLETQPSDANPIVRVSNFRYGNNTETKGFSYSFQPSREKLPKAPCTDDIFDGYVSVVFHEETIRKSVLDLINQKAN